VANLPKTDVCGKNFSAYLQSELVMTSGDFINGGRL